jgi:predicted Zn-dependent protease with MMP-like domain
MPRDEHWFTRSEFEGIVNDALDSLPKRFADLIENVAITVDDEPSRNDLGRPLGRNRELLGVYRGVALTQRTSEAPLLPDQITIFRGPISRVTRTRDEAVEQVRKTVIHEIGHYFGLTDEELP